MTTGQATNFLDLLAFVLITPQIIRLFHIKDALRRPWLFNLPEFMMYRAIIKRWLWTTPMLLLIVVSNGLTVIMWVLATAGIFGHFGPREQLLTRVQSTVCLTVSVSVYLIVIVRNYDLESVALTIGAIAFFTARIIGILA